MSSFETTGLGRFTRDRGAVVAGIGLSVAIVLAICAPLLFKTDAFAMVGKPFLWPGVDPRFPLGTDMFGRDILTGIVYGARISLLVGLTAATISTAVGIAVGVVSGYFGGWIDHLLMRLTELFQTMPPLVFVVTIVAILQPSIFSIVVAIGFTSWTQTARLIRAETLRIRESEFVQAAFALGLSPVRIVVKHVLLNAVSPAIVTGTILAGSAILTEAALSFLGLGDPNVMSWGSMIGAGRQVLRTAWYIAAIPGVAIVLTVLAITALGSGLNFFLNPRAAD
ncbi:MAG: ABC transporter permease [Reyranella sp.]|jgi:peptide/nickel transport system permease protein|uniref:ABC transporter permease n=1 Tax=Reyranella sp. TaxID=1929291 RepID=UPI0025FDF5EE|nr:ABC transporter permease [Reyranella sp.]MBR2814876.1 ABC transporter permease [Reyranella sp.]